MDDRINNKIKNWLENTIRSLIFRKTLEKIHEEAVSDEIRNILIDSVLKKKESDKNNGNSIKETKNS